MAIVGIDRLTGPELSNELRRGARFVTYKYCISVIVVTIWRTSDVYFIPAGQSAVASGLPFTVTSLLLGWWGFPIGPIVTVWVVVSNLLGGKYVTSKVVAALHSMGRFRQDQHSAQGGVSKERKSGPTLYSAGYTIQIDQPPRPGK
jgi:hypothetical protein